MEKPGSRWLRRRGFAGTILLLIVAFATLAQTRSNGTIPADLKPSLDARLAQFTEAQADGRWDDVAAMLGRYRMGGVGHHLLAPEAKACLVTQMKEIPMISFKMKDYTFSTEILSLPLDKRSWDLIGEAVFRPARGEQMSQSKVTAYRDKDEWYFSPPDFDSYWLKSHLTEADFAIDRADEIEIEDTPTSPLQITDVHAFLDKEYSSLLSVSYELKNRTSKKVSAFTVRFFDAKGGSVEYSAPHGIEPAGSVEEKESLSRWAYFCDGATQHKFVVVSVSFADGTEWNRPKRQ